MKPEPAPALGVLTCDELELAGHAEVIRSPSLRQSDHDRGCPWARWYQPSRDPAECACAHAAPFRVRS